MPPFQATLIFQKHDKILGPQWLPKWPTKTIKSSIFSNKSGR